MQLRALGSDCYDAAIIGAGPAGSSMAVALAVQGWRVLLIERDRFPRHKVCGEFLSPEAQDSLRRIGLFGEVAALGPVPLAAVAVVSQQGRKVHRPLPGRAWGVSRLGLDGALAQAAVARGVELWTAATATHCRSLNGRTEVQVRRADRTHGFRSACAREKERPNDSIQARTVVLAHGHHGLPALASGERGRDAVRPRPRYVGIKRHLAGLALTPQVELFLFPGGYAGLNPVEGGRANFCLLASYRAFARAGRTVDGMLAAAAAGNPALAQRLAGAQPVMGTDSAVAPVDTGRPPAPWHGGARLGDSAVMLPPLCGDGMAMALRSAELCAPLADAFLRGELSETAWAAAYARAWRAEFAHRVWLGRALQQALHVPLLADALLALGASFPPLADYVVRSTRGKPSAPVAADAGGRPIA
jgi:flavin-dependent dehydrogenase